MADIDIRRTHHMDPRQARAAADTMADRLGRKFGLKGDWDGDTMRFQGTGVTGTLTVGAKDLHIAATLGFLLKAMKGSIEQAVTRELDQLLAAAPAAKPAAAKASGKAAPAAKAKAATSKKAAPRAKKAR
jgi:putative polyhydroxyalkanoate system protein